MSSEDKAIEALIALALRPSEELKDSEIEDWLKRHGDRKVKLSKEDALALRRTRRKLKQRIAEILRQ